MKKTNENTKVTLTFKQLKRLVKEAKDVDITMSGPDRRRPGYVAANNGLDITCDDVIFKNFSLKNRMNSLVWCSCQSELSGNGRDVVRSLITKFGEKNWRQSRKLFKNSDYSKWSNRKISK